MSWLFPPIGPLSAATATYNGTVSGGFIVTGTRSALAVEYVYAVDGGVVLAGASTQAQVKAPSVSGGVVVSGTRVLAIEYVYAISGGVVVAGTGAFSFSAGAAAGNSLGARMLEHIVNVAAPENLKLRVFKNNITPASTMTVADYTEATFSGYLAVTLTSADWTITHDGTFAFATASSEVMFASSATTDETVYGYYMTGVDSSTLYWAQAFPAAFRVYNLGDAVVPTSALQLGMP